MLPAEREEPYFESFRPVAQAVQEVSRCWAPVSWFWNFTEQVEVYVPQARLAFASTPLSSLQSVETLAYEVLDDNSRRRALEGARLAIPPRLERARRLLLDAGLPMRANNYLPRAASKIYRTQLRQRRTYDTYLLADAQTVDQLALLATAGRNLRQAALREPARAARRLFEFMTDFHISMGRRTRRMFPNGDLAEYPSLVLLEATHALAPEFKREATLILRQGAREIVLRN
jgi:hypothetical protein